MADEQGGLQARRAPNKNKGHRELPRIRREHKDHYRGIEPQSRLLENHRGINESKPAAELDSPAPSVQENIPVGSAGASNSHAASQNPPMGRDKKKHSQKKQEQVVPGVSLLSNVEFMKKAAQTLAGRKRYEDYNQFISFRPGYQRQRDERYWDKGFYDKQNIDFVLVKRGVLPSKAVEEIFKNPGKWNFDCSEFVQVILLYTLLNTIGAQAFDKLHRDPDGAFRLRRHYSTLLGEENLRPGWKHNFETGVLETISPKAREMRDIDTVLREAPAGSIVVFRNTKLLPLTRGEIEKKKAESKTGEIDLTNVAFVNENTIKLGPDQFLAFGFELGKFVYSRKEIERSLAAAGHTPKNGDSHYFIRIESILPYAVPLN